MERKVLKGGSLVHSYPTMATAYKACNINGTVHIKGLIGMKGKPTLKKFSDKVT